MTTLFFLFLTFMTQANDTLMVFYPGMSAKIPAPSGQSIQIEKKGLFSIKDQGSQLKLTAKKTGSTKLHFTKESIELHVITRKRYKAYLQLKDWQKNKLGPELSIKEGVPLLRGNLYTISDLHDLFQRNIQTPFINQMSVETSLLQKVNTRIEEELQKSSLPGGRLQLSPVWTLLSNNKTESVHALYRQALTPMGVRFKSSPLAVSRDPLIQVRILALEVKRSYLQKMGVQWPSQLSMNLFKEAGASLVDQAQLFVDAMENHSSGEILASPTLVTRSGQEANFHAGGEIPIQTANQFNTNVEWKQYGILLKIKPQSDYSGLISLQLDCEVSDVQIDNVVSDLPSFTRNKISSSFHIEQGKTIAISGLLKKNKGQQSIGLPYLQRLPILGRLFSSKGFNEDKTELVFLVTPTIKEIQ